MSDKDQHHIKEWAKIRETSLEIAEAIFEVANNDEALAQKIWAEGSDKVLEMAFAKTTKDHLFWEKERIDRSCV